jgi:hypothetical protein
MLQEEISELEESQYQHQDHRFRGKTLSESSQYWKPATRYSYMKRRLIAA